jgi:hypothetical protein
MSHYYQSWADADGRLHRDDDLPALVWSCGLRKEWYWHGERHRDGDLPAVECAWGDDGNLLAMTWGPNNGYKLWYRHNKLHRDGDLPAVM